MKLFQKEKNVEETEEELANKYDASLITYQDYLNTQKAMQETFHKLGEKMWALKNEIAREGFIYGENTIQEKQALFDKLDIERRLMVDNWIKEQRVLKENIDNTFMTFIEPYLDEMNTMKTNLRKTGSVSHLQRKVRDKGGELVRVIKTNHYSVQRAYAFLTTQAAELTGLKGKDSSEILLKVAEISKNCPVVEFEEHVPTLNELEHLQQVSQAIMDLRDEAVVKADPNSIMRIQNPRAEAEARQIKDERAYEDDQKFDKKLVTIKKAKTQFDLMK
jgi:Na+-transporting NADH:ubiquinone oxidoreductase subunit NqrC